MSERMTTQSGQKLFSKIASFAFFLAFIIFFAAVRPGPTRSLGFAAFYFSAGIASLALCLRDHGRMKYGDGSSASIASTISMILLFFIWGLCSVGDARGWSFFQQHSLLLHLIPAGLATACIGFERLRALLQSARSAQIRGDKRFLWITAIALIALLAWIGYLCSSFLN